jgi:hypothetical protein
LQPSAQQWPLLATWQAAIATVLFPAVAYACLMVVATHLRRWRLQLIVVVAEFVRQRVTSPPAAFEVGARVQAPAVDVRRRIGAWASVEPAGDGAGGGCLVRMTGDQLEWSVLGLSMLDAEFTVVGPPALRAHFAEVGARFTRAAAS